MTLLKNLFFKFSPILKFEIKEESMMPNLKPGDLVLVETISKLFGTYKEKDIVVFRKENKILIKKIQNIHDRKYFVVGDNVLESKDSRHFGWVDKKYIIGKVFYIFQY